MSKTQTPAITDPEMGDLPFDELIPCGLEEARALAEAFSTPTGPEESDPEQEEKTGDS